MIKCNYCKNKVKNGCYCNLVRATMCFGYNNYKLLPFKAPNILNKSNKCELHKPNLMWKIKMIWQGKLEVVD